MVHGSASLRYNKGHRVGGHFALPEKSAALIALIARLDGTFGFLFMPKSFSMAEFFASIDTGHHGAQKRGPQ
jgi:hypothetical protein